MREERVNKLKIILSISAFWIIFIADVLVHITNMFGEQYWRELSRIRTPALYFATFVFVLFPLTKPVIMKMYDTIKPYGKYTSGIIYAMTIFLVSSLCPYLHISYSYYSITSGYLYNNITTDTGILTDILNGFDYFKNPVGLLYMALSCVIFILLFIVIISGKTKFPRWFAFINPLVSILLKLALSVFSQEIADLLWPLLIPAFGIAVFFTGVAFLTWNGD